MMEVRIQVDDELAVKGYRKALRLRAVAELAKFYANVLVIFTGIIGFVDFFMEAGHLIFWHFLAVLGICLFGAVYGYIEWERKIAQLKGWSFSARLDEMGVTTLNPHENWYEWSSYKGYREFEDYLEIERLPGEISFLPKTPELFRAIEFTKEKIPPKN